MRRHGHAYVAVSRVHTAEELGAFVNSACSEERADGARCAILASVTYPELLAPRAQAAVAAPRGQPAAGDALSAAGDAPFSVLPNGDAPRPAKRARISLLLEHMDDARAAQQMRQ